MQYKCFKHACLSAVVGAAWLTGCLSNAWAADPCDSLGSNKDWQNGIDKINNAYTNGQHEKAIQEGLRLFEICEKSPILNFTLGRLYQETNDSAKALYYFQRATLYADEYKVGKETLEIMWYERYETEHPDARPSSIEKMKKENEELKAIVVENQKTMTQHRFTEMQNSYSDSSIYAAGMWTGVAVGAAGIALTVTGAIMLVNAKDDAINFDNDKATANVKGAYNTYWALLGSGIGLTVVGAVFTGFMGYHYVRTKKAADDTVSFNISPTSASLSLSF